MDLGGQKWKIKQVGTMPIGSPEEPLEFEGEVPGEVHVNLLQADIIEDPYVGYREIEYRWIGLSDWEYSRTFDVPSDLLSHSIVELKCESIDTISTITINGIEIGKTDNMFRAFSFDIKSALVTGSNNIAVRIQSAATYAKEEADSSAKSGKVYPLWEYPHGEKHRNLIRKCGCHFGWDWGPCFVPSGIVGSIKIVATSLPIITHVTTSQHWHSIPDGPVDLTISVHLRHPTTPILRNFDLAVTFDESSIYGPNTPKKEAKIEKIAPNKEVVRVTHQITTPKMWWPNGHGPQNLMQLKVEVISKEGTKEGTKEGKKNNWEGRVGLRHLELDTSADETGEKFQFVVNGKPIFAKGADWIPADSFQTRITSARLKSLLQSAKDANFNMLRVWGGGIYESDEFYNICDELGLLLWQDMMFACALYPATTKFVKNVAKEIKYQIRRLNHHPSIALYCGNNENEEAMGMWEESKNSRDKYVVDYHMLYIETIMPTIMKEDNTRKFWPSSPSNGIGAWGNPQDSTRGDTHYWGVWHSNKPFTEYLSVKSRFCSEFGFQSLPRIHALRSTIPVLEEEEAKLNDIDESEFLNLSAPFLDYKQRSPTPGNKGLLTHIATHFRVPKSFELFVYLSQVLQAVSIKTACEHFRRQMPYCMGSLYWQLNDIWEGPSWSSLEYDGTWKILHSMAQHFYSPVLVSAVENGENVDIWVTNDGGAIEGFLNVDTWRWDATVASPAPRVLKHIQCKESSSSCVWSIPTTQLLSSVKAERNQAFLTLKLVVKGIAYKNYHFFAPLKRVTLPKAHITHEVVIFSPSASPSSTPITPKISLARSLPNSISSTSSTSLSSFSSNSSTSTSSSNSSSSSSTVANSSSIVAPNTPPPIHSIPKFEVILKSDRVAPYVYLQSGKYRGNFADNGFLLLAGEERRIQFSTLEGEHLPDLNSFIAELSVCSLRDSY